LDFVEYYLGLSEINNIPWLSEQTCWALLFERTGNKLFCPAEEQFVCRESLIKPDSNTLAIHLIGNLKQNCLEWSNYQRETRSYPSSIQFELSRNVTVFDWMLKSAQRFFFK